MERIGSLILKYNLFLGPLFVQSIQCIVQLKLIQDANLSANHTYANLLGVQCLAGTATF